MSATRLGVLATLFGSTAFAMTLMACYGCPDCTYPDDLDGGRDARAKSSSSSSSGSAGDDDDVTEPKDAEADADGAADADASDSGPKDAAADG